MRCTQIFGLPDEAREFLKKECEIINDSLCPHCNEVVSMKMNSRPYDTAEELGMFNDGPTLIEYILKDGSIVREVVQSSMWSSGPCIFLSLEKDDGEILFEWSAEDVNDA